MSSLAPDKPRASVGKLYMEKAERSKRTWNLSQLTREGILCVNQHGFWYLFLANKVASLLLTQKLLHQWMDFVVFAADPAAVVVDQKLPLPRQSVNCPM